MAKYTFYETELINDLRHLVIRAADKFDDKIAHREYDFQHNIVEISFRTFHDDMKALGTALYKQGFKGYHFGIVADNSSAWLLSYLAVINGVGVVVPLDKELTLAQSIELINKGDVKVLFLEERFYERINEIKLQCPQLIAVIIIRPIPKEDYGDCYLLEELIREGHRLIAEGFNDYIEANIDREAPAAILFTSGTTGANKGVMLSQKNIISCVLASAGVMHLEGESISLLPFNHSYELSCHILTAFYIGMTVNINDSLKNVIENFNVFKPQFSTLVPMFLEAFYRNIKKESIKNNLDGHLNYGIKASNIMRKFGIDGRRKFFEPVLENFGGNFDTVISGGAPIAPHIFKFFTDIGINIGNGYGITECSPLVCAWNQKWKGKNAYSVGKAVPGCEVRIFEPDKEGVGEIQVYGDNVMIGYYKDEEATRASFTEDGWFRTGDLGYMDKKGFVYLNGRQKDLIILSNGKNIYPEQLEDHLRSVMDYIKETLVYSVNDKEGLQTGIEALCYIDPEWAIKRTQAEISDTIAQDLKTVNKTLPFYMHIKRIHLKEEEFIKTSSHKIKRFNYVVGGQIR